MIPLRGEYARLSAEMDGYRFDWEDDEIPDMRWYHYVLAFVLYPMLRTIVFVLRK